MNTRPFVLHSEHGSTLIVTIILLFIITVMAVTEVTFNSLLTRIATNSADALIAYQTAEGALNQAVNKILTGTYKVSNFIANTNGLYLFDPTIAPVWTTVNWGSASAAVQSYQGNSSARATYIIEQLPSVTLPGQSMSKATSIYRITIRAVGASGSSPTVLQAIVQIPQ